MKNIRKCILSAVLICALMAVSCSGGGGGGGSDSSAASDVTGAWQGTYSTSLVATSDLSLTLTQESNEFSGTYTTEDSGGSITGTVSGKAITFDLDPAPECPGDFDGSGTIEGSTIVLTFSGANCLGNHRNGRADLNKQ